MDILIQQLISNNQSAFVDVGTNIGQTFLKLKTLYPEKSYIGFEPNPSCVFYMQQLCKINNFTDNNIYNCALSSSVQIKMMEKTLIDDVRASIIPSLRPGFLKFKEPVLTLNYDSFFFDQNISFVKIDVEGAELEVIEGMKKSILRYQPLIVCEVLDCHQLSVFEFIQERATKLSSLLSEMNYSIIKIKASKNEHSIISFFKIDEIKIEQWAENSLYFNDYLFYPSVKEYELFSKLTQISKIIEFKSV